jgi:hypothetical protein
MHDPEVAGNGGSGPRGAGSDARRDIHSRYADGTPVYEGQQSDRFGASGATPEAEGAPHTAIRWDGTNERIYATRTFGPDGQKRYDIDFTIPTTPDGRPRPGHSAPEVHEWLPVDPDNPRAGVRRESPGRPLDPNGPLPYP